MNKKLIFTLLFSSISTSAMAVTFDTPINANALITSNSSLQLSLKPITLMNLKLSPAEKMHFLAAPKFDQVETSTDLPSKADVGMNKVPVLDQGQHGSCVTFASAAVIDALLNKGDYVSPLCSLELGGYLEKNGYFPSGWDGSYGVWVLNQMLQFGIVTKAQQEAKVCAGVVTYPVDRALDEGKIFPLEQYKAASVNIASSMEVLPILNAFARFDSAVEFNGKKTLKDVKSTLAKSVTEDNSTRITFGVLLPVSYCQVGACGSYHAQYDTWALSKAIANDKNPRLGGHEMIITAYDDNATVKDNEGGIHKGLLTLRNSWGTDAGDKGNYYMSYDFFTKFVLEVHAVAIANNQS